METTHIYILKDPRTNEIRYVGKSNNPIERFKNHNNKARDKNTHKRNWLNQLREEKLKPILEIIDTVSIENWKEWEKYYIKKYIDGGCKLVNHTEGGDGLNFGNQTSYKLGNGARKVVMLEKDGTYVKTFDMIIDAEKFIGKNNGPSQVLSKRNKTCGGYLFIYEEEYKNMTKEDIKKIVDEAIFFRKPNKGSFPKKIIYQYDLKLNFIKKWESLAEASKILNISKSAICQCAKGKIKSSSGYFWSYKKIN